MALEEKRKDQSKQEAEELQERNALDDGETCKQHACAVQACLKKSGFQTKK